MRYHLTVGGSPWCDWTGTQAGLDLCQRTHVSHRCGHQTRRSADSHAKSLRPHFKRGAVAVVTGPCPSMEDLT